MSSEQSNLGGLTCPTWSALKTFFWKFITQAHFLKIQQNQKYNMLYILTSVWVLSTQKLIKICFFDVFGAKTLKKGRKSKKIEAKYWKKYFLSLHQNVGLVFYSQKNTFSVVKTGGKKVPKDTKCCKMEMFCNKTLN